MLTFAIRVGGAVTDAAGTWLDFDSTFGSVGDWSGILSEGPVKGDLIEFDYVDGAMWQQGPRSIYSFDVPYTSLNADPACQPNLWDSYQGVNSLRSYQGPLLTMRRIFFDKDGVEVRRDQAFGVLVNDLPVTSIEGRILQSVAVFQNTSGSWTAV